jgi:hypothetical protein
MSEREGFRLSGSVFKIRPDGGIDCAFNSPHGRISCILHASAVDLMTGRSPSERAWDIICRDWGAELSVIAAEQYRLRRSDPILITADEVRPYGGDRRPGQFR